MRRRTTSSLPGLSRQSILLRKKMDARVKPAHDGVTPAAPVGMKRRAFITLLAGATAWPLVARAQPTGKIYRIGFLTAGSGPSPLQREFVAALAALGYQEGRNVAIEWRYGAGELGRLTDLERDLVRANVDVIVTESTPSAVAARQATAQSPIVMATSGDPIGSGLIASLARPGGNVTGLTTLAPELDRKRLELLRELVPSARRIAFFGNNQNSGEQIGFRGVQTAAARLGIAAVFVTRRCRRTSRPRSPKWRRRRRTWRS